MKKRNIGICIITTTLLMGGPAKATELILAKDHTNVVNQAAEIAAYKSNRPPVNKRLFKSKAGATPDRDVQRDNAGEK